MWSRNEPMDISGTNKQRMRGRRRYYGKRGKYNPGKQALQRVNRLEKQLKKAENLKSNTTAIALSLATGTPQLSSLVAMSRGVTNVLREGDKITLKNMTWRIQLTLNTAEANPTGVRFIVVYDRRPEGVQAAWTDIFNATSINGLMNLDEDTRGRFQIVHDQFWQLATGGTELVMEKGFKDLRNKKVLYDANAGDITDVQQGNLFAGFVSVGNASTLGASGYIRIRFVDDN